MGLAEVQKVQILAHTSVKMDLLSSLQEEGLVQLERANFEELDLGASFPDCSKMDHRLHRLSHALDYLSSWEEKGFVKKLFSQKPQVQRKKREEVLSFDDHSILENIDSIQEEKNELLSDLRFLKKEEQSLSPFKDLEFPIKSFEATDSTEILLGWMPLSQMKSCQELAEKEPLYYRIVSQTKRNVYIILIYHKKERDRFLHACKELQFIPLLLTDSIIKLADETDTVGKVIDKVKKEMEKITKRLDDLEKDGQSLFVHREKLMLIYDVLLNEREKMSSSRLLGETERVLYLEGWIRSSDLKRLQSKLQPFEDSVELCVRRPFAEEDPPVILDNPKPTRPFEMVTKLYGLPQRGSLDPTLALAPFFFLFVGLCVSEAGYGILVALLSSLFIKFAKPKGGLLIFMKLLFLLGVSTLILGTLVGGWFGFPIRSLMVLDPLEDPLSFLMLALVLGFIQVWFGTLLNMINGIKNKAYLQAIFVQGGWLLLLPSLVLYMLTKHSFLGILTLLGAVGIIFFASPSRNPAARFFGGLYSLYNISRYLADVLSYSRLLALGLATSVIAMVVNTLCQTALQIPWLGWLLAALIFVGGHLFNLGISFLGGFVHSMRLQFVEFFSKFFISGGSPFKAFELETKYVEFI
jgi:V/A-type H+-transporting ATPase subunit I